MLTWIVSYRGLYFDESTLPARPARAPTLDAKSGTFATNTSIPQFTKPSSVGPRAVRNGSSNELAAGVQEQSRKLSQGGDFTSEFGSGWKEDGAPTPKSIGGTTKEPLRPDTSQIFRSDAYIPPTSRSSPPGERLIQVVDNNRDELGQSLPSQRSLEDDRIKSTIESPDGSPGVDPAKAMPISSEEVATLSAPLVAHSGLDGHHVARTIHLPARGTQERHARAIGEAHDREKQRDTGDEREGGRTQPSGPPGSVEPESSPSSTTGAYSTNTPGLNAASPDTSPDDEQPLDNAGALRSKVPPDLVPNEGERLAKVEHDTLLKSQMQIAHTDAFAQTISNPDAQLRLEEEQAARGGASSGNVESGTTALPDTVPTSDQLLEAVGRSPLTTRASELVQGIMEDEEDEVVGVPTPEGNAMLHDRRKSPPISTSGLDIPSSSSQDAAPSLAAVEYSSRVNVELGPTRQNHGPASRNSALTPIRTDLSVPPKDDSAGEGINRRPLTGLVDSPEALEASVRSRPDLDEDTVMQDGSVVGNAAPLKSVSTPTSVQSPPERMTTRVSSGALRHKSVSEILGETPKPLLNKISTPASKPESTSQPPTPTTESNEPHSPLAIIRNGERREKERSKLSTVIFAKQQRQSKADSSPLSQRKASSVGQVMEDDKDYFYPLFAQTASHSRSPQLHKLLETARKTISTADLYVNAHEQQDCRILRRIYQLQFANRWSLRQMERSIEPPRPKAHWDSLLDEMKWMRTDFREERKWKIAAAKNLADWCAQWVASSPEARTFLQVRVKVMYPASKTGGISRDAGVTGDSVRSEGTIESHLTSSESITDTKAVGDNINLLNPCEAPAPAGIFSLGAGEITFGMKKTPSSDRLLAELPIYEPFGREPDVDLSKSEVSADSDWKTSILPITKYAMAKILSKEDGPPRKRSRYDYDDEGDEGSLDLRSDFEKLRAGIGTTTKPSPSVLPSEQNDVALFNPDNKHIRDRIHASHAFRPPSEYNMPSQSFFENRTSSQWTWSEDVQLRELVRGYSYNWSLISSIMSPQSIFSSGAERRTPWECFERWIGLEGLPGDMQKTQYFRAYHSRLDAAQRNVAAQQQAVSQQGSSAGPPSTPLRRRTTLPIKVDRRRNNKHLALVDAMRKLAKKRETTLSKQQHCQSSCTVSPYTVS